MGTARQKQTGMRNRLTGIIQTLQHKRSLRRWDRLEKHAHSAELEQLRDLRQMARQLRQRVNNVGFIADMRLTLPVIGSNAMSLPAATDWSYRPNAWSGPIFPPGYAPVRNKAPIGNDLTVFHDCKTPNLSLRQIRNTDPRDLAPFRLALDVFEFDGSFLSMVLQAPPSAVSGLKKRHVIRLSMNAQSERPLEMSARLNLKHGPNTEQVSQEIDLSADNVVTEFDLAYTRFNESRVEQIWVDLFFASPSMNRVEIRDITLSRHPRAEL